MVSVDGVHAYLGREVRLPRGEKLLNRTGNRLHGACFASGGDGGAKVVSALSTR